MPTTLVLVCTDHNGHTLASHRITRESRIEVDADEKLAMADLVRQYPGEYVFHHRLASDNKHTLTESWPRIRNYYEGFPEPSFHELPKPRSEEANAIKVAMRDGFRAGDRVQINQLAIDANIGRKNPNRKGTVVGISRQTGNPLVRWDNLITPESYSPNFLKLALE